MSSFSNATFAPAAYLFTDAQKGVLPLAVLPCAIVGFLWYRFLTKYLGPEETPQDRAEYFYTCLSAACFGKFFFHALPNATLYSGLGYPVISIFVFIGFFIMICIHKLKRVTGSTDYYIAPPDTVVAETHIKNKKTGTTATYAEINNWDEPQLGLLDAHDEWNDIAKRRFIAIITIAILIVITVLEGMFLIFNAPVSPGGPPVIVAIFFLDKILVSCIYYGSLSNGDFHGDEKKRCCILKVNSYHYLSILWLVTVILSCTFVLAEMPLEQVDMAIRHPAMGIFHALAGGILFFVAFYFIWMDRHFTDRKETAVRLIIFGSIGVVSWGTGFFI